jgi:hypothetical protein
MVSIYVVRKSGLLTFTFFDTDSKYEALDKAGISRDEIVSVTVGDSLIRKHLFVDKEISFKDAFHYAGVKNRGITIFDGTSITDDNKTFNDFNCDEEHYLLKAYTMSV